jgi:hypothetical protein
MLRIERGVTYGVDDQGNMIETARDATAPRKRGAVSVGPNGEKTTLEPLVMQSLAIFGRGEPKLEGRCFDSKRRAQSLWTALLNMPADAYGRMALEYFGLTRAADRACLMRECVLWAAQKTDRVEVTRREKTIIRWKVWIDPKGSFAVEVFP